MAGPTGTGAINFDSFVTSTPPPAPMPGGVKKITASDSKSGPPNPASNGGNSKSGHGNKDSYYE